MKNLFIYYLVIIIPIVILSWMSRTNFLDSTLFVILLFFYVFIFRTYIDGKRLVDKNIIPKKDIWKMIIPGKRFQYFRELYLK
jgi:Ca2+/Na+ antiporter|tara:strand:- start:1231 stop:1479 length:249 start_codon:yes stop_codon:yes gene_type:complete